MHDDDNRFQRFVPLLRRVIILLAVLAATPVVLWMITAFVRTYVGPPRVPALRQIASTAPIAAPATAAVSMPNSDQATGAPAKIADITASTTDVTATTSDPRDVPSPKGSMLADRPSDSAAPAPANLPTVAPVAPTPWPSQASGAATVPLNGTATTSTNSAQSPQQPATGAVTAEASPPPAVAEQSPDVMPPAPPLTGKIPLPRHRPHGLGDAGMTLVAQGAVPVPRPRPDAAGPASTPDAASPGPLDFLQNIFHQ
jgi:hypothetical protein